MQARRTVGATVALQIGQVVERRTGAADCQSGIGGRRTRTLRQGQRPDHVKYDIGYHDLGAFFVEHLLGGADLERDVECRPHLGDEVLDHVSHLVGFHLHPVGHRLVDLVEQALEHGEVVEEHGHLVGCDRDHPLEGIRQVDRGQEHPGPDLGQRGIDLGIEVEAVDLVDHLLEHPGGAVGARRQANRGALVIDRRQVEERPHVFEGGVERAHEPAAPLMDHHHEEF